MGMDDKIRNKVDEVKGGTKESAGRAMDDREMETEGKVDKTKANLKQAGEKVKDAFK